MALDPSLDEIIKSNPSLVRLLAFLDAQRPTGHFPRALAFPPKLACTRPGRAARRHRSGRAVAGGMVVVLGPPGEPASRTLARRRRRRVAAARPFLGRPRDRRFAAQCADPAAGNPLGSADSRRGGSRAAVRRHRRAAERAARSGRGRSVGASFATDPARFRGQAIAAAFLDGCGPGHPRATAGRGATLGYRAGELVFWGPLARRGAGRRDRPNVFPSGQGERGLHRAVRPGFRSRAAARHTAWRTTSRRGRWPCRHYRVGSCSPAPTGGV